MDEIKEMWKDFKFFAFSMSVMCVIFVVLKLILNYND